MSTGKGERVETLVFMINKKEVKCVEREGEDEKTSKYP